MCPNSFTTLSLISVQLRVIKSRHHNILTDMMLLQFVQRSGRDTGASLPDGTCSASSSARNNDSSAERLYVTASSSLSMSQASWGLISRRHLLFSCMRRCMSGSCNGSGAFSFGIPARRGESQRPKTQARSVVLNTPVEAC